MQDDLIQLRSSFYIGLKKDISMKAKDWLAFAALSIAWGSSFLWIKIAVQEVGGERFPASNGRCLGDALTLQRADAKQALRQTRQPRLSSERVFDVFNCSLAADDSVHFQAVGQTELRITN
ncbi:MAG: hypothetical protein ABFS02_08855, partial [Pseudomonadota bacterium]